MEATKVCLKVLKREQAKIAASRDRLRDLLDEVEGQIESCDRGLEDLACAIDTLSQYV